DRLALGRGHQGFAKSLLVVRMIPAQHLFAAEYGAGPLGGLAFQQCFPVVTEKYLTCGEIPIPDREIRADQRQVQTLFGATDFALRAPPVGDVASNTDAKTLSADI